ncbi:MAG TPA: TMEM165/GDT1 family protein [Thermoplasmata archaeon]|nr:TMEM165/GDT1 family protein [Thermoplasmata archaeon]
MDLGTATGFAVVFAVVGGLEVFDRTSFALIAIATRAHALATWVGGSAAFLGSTVIAVVVGTTLEDVLGPSRIGLLRAAGGAFLLAYAGWLYFHAESAEKSTDLTRAARSAFLVAFGTIFLLELGDTTMIFEIVFVSDWGPWVVLVAGSLALSVVAAWDVVLGQRLGARLDPVRLRKIVVVVLVVVGVVTIVYGLAPSAIPSLSVGWPF